MTPLWQILIPTLADRRALLDRLKARLVPQLTPRVGILEMLDGGERSIGAKRQALLEHSQADWVSFVDDDDLVADDYVARVLAVIEPPDAPDVVGFRLRFWKDGTLAGHAVHSYLAGAIPSPAWVNRGHKRYERQPNHLNPVRREWALRAGGYQNLNHGEDGDYARRLARLDPRPREVFVDAELYEYVYVSPEKRAHERTNEKLARKRA